MTIGYLLATAFFCSASLKISSSSLTWAWVSPLTRVWYQTLSWPASPKQYPKTRVLIFLLWSRFFYLLGSQGISSKVLESMRNTLEYWDWNSSLCGQNKLSIYWKCVGYFFFHIIKQLFQKKTPDVLFTEVRLRMLILSNCTKWTKNKMLKCDIWMVKYIVTKLQRLLADTLTQAVTFQ